MEQEAIYVGIDVAKAQLDVAVRPVDEGWVVSNDDAGVRQLISRLKTLEPVIVVLEASGGIGSPHPFPVGARTVAWVNQTRILQGWAIS